MWWGRSSVSIDDSTWWRVSSAPDTCWWQQWMGQLAVIMKCFARLPLTNSLCQHVRFVRPPRDIRRSQEATCRAHADRHERMITGAIMPASQPHEGGQESLTARWLRQQHVICQTSLVEEVSMEQHPLKYIDSVLLFAQCGYGSLRYPNTRRSFIRPVL